MKVTVCWNSYAVDGVQPAPRAYYVPDCEAVQAEACSPGVFVHTVEVRGMPDDTLTRWERVYAAAFARIMLEQGEPALDDERVIAHAKALAERIADEGAKK